MKMEPINSSNIEAIGYDEDKRILQVDFHSSRSYHYFDVDKSLYEEFLNAPSIGQFFLSNIKNKFKYEQI